MQKESSWLRAKITSAQMAGAALAWRGTFPKQFSRSIVRKTATGSAVKTIPGQHSTGGKLISWPVPAKAHPGGWMEIPCSDSPTLKPQNISPIAAG